MLARVGVNPRRGHNGLVERIHIGDGWFCIYVEFGPRIVVNRDFGDLPTEPVILRHTTTTRVWDAWSAYDPGYRKKVVTVHRYLLDPARVFYTGSSNAEARRLPARCG